jgi:hypothetical protein
MQTKGEKKGIALLRLITLLGYGDTHNSDTKAIAFKNS